jgi:hypothetical protein
MLTVGLESDGEIKKRNIRTRVRESDDEMRS